MAEIHERHPVLTPDSDFSIYRKHGRYVRYDIEDLVDYSKASKRRSTSNAD